MKKNRINMELICAIRNIVALICFTALAIIFHKWWIVFFSIIFFAWVEDDKNGNK